MNPIKVCGTFTGELGDLRLDSRQILPGDIFIAVRGSQMDGHQFITSAIGNGAAAILAEQLPKVPTNVLGVKIDNTGHALGRLAQTYYGDPAEKLNLVGVTGTNGKTTVTTLVHQVLTRLGSQAGLIGTNVNRIGDREFTSKLTTPDATELARLMRDLLSEDVHTLCMEVSSHALKQGRVDGVHFNVAAFTNLSLDHLDYHTDFTDYLNSKKLLFDGLDETAIAIVNADDEKSYEILADCKADVWQLSFKDGSSKILDSGTDGLVLEVDGTVIQSPLSGDFNAYNVAMAYMIATALGLSKSNVAAALAEAHGAEGRLEKIQLDDHSELPAVFVDYAHTPDALENVLKAINAVKDADQKVHVIFGCGGDRDKSKRPKMASVAEEHADLITVTSDNPRSEVPDAIIDDIFTGFKKSSEIERESDRKTAITNVVENASSDTIVLIAGKGHESYQEISGIRYDLDDRKIAREALARNRENLHSKTEGR